MSSNVLMLSSKNADVRKTFSPSIWDFLKALELKRKFIILVFKIWSVSCNCTYDTCF